MSKRKEPKVRQETGLAAFAVAAGKAHISEHGRTRTWNWRLCKQETCRARQAEYDKKFVAR